MLATALLAFVAWWFLPPREPRWTTGRPSAATFSATGLRAELPSATASSLEPILRDARRTANLLVERFARDPHTLHVAAQLRYQLGETTAAVQLWQDCLRLDSHDVEAQVAIGTFLFESGEFAEAERVLLAAVLQAPANSRAAYLLASSLLNQGKLDETVEVLRGSLSIDPRSLPNQVLLGQAFLGLRQHERAKACFLAAVELEPAYPNARFGLAAACDALGEADEAAQHRRIFRELQADQLRQAIDQTGRHDDASSTRRDIAEFYVAAGRLYLERGDEAAAQEHWQSALELDPENERGRAALAQLYAGTGRLREAVEILLPLQTTRAADASFWQGLAQLYVRLQAFDEADDALRRVVELEPQQASGYAARAQLRLQRNRDQGEAAELARQAVERAPSAANYFLWSVACQRSGDDSQAKAAVAKALELDAGNAQYQQLYLTLEAKR